MGVGNFVRRDSYVGWPTKSNGAASLVQGLYDCLLCMCALKRDCALAMMYQHAYIISNILIECLYMRSGLQAILSFAP